MGTDREHSGNRQALGVGMVGYAFMGSAHSQAWRGVGRTFDPPRHAEMVALCGRDRDRATAAADRMGWRSVETDWKDLVARDDVDLVDICSPGDSHAEIAIAALEAGKHVLCEKPLATNSEEAAAMVDAARRAAAHGVRSMVGFNYRHVPAIAAARTLVAEGRLGTLRHVRVQYLQDWSPDPEFPLGWRPQRARAGSGALVDIGSHVVDLAQFVTGQKITGVAAVTETFAAAAGAGAGADAGAGAGAGRGTATIDDDAAMFLARFGDGALGNFEATRFASGRKNAMRIEVNGSHGSIAFDLESISELLFHDHTEDARTAGFRRIHVTAPGPTARSPWWPSDHLLGYEHTLVQEVHHLLESIGAGCDPCPSFEDGLGVQRVLDAVETSAANQSMWTVVEGSTT